MSMDNKVAKLFGLYWEADRNDVKSRYESIFCLPEDIIGKNIANIPEIPPPTFENTLSIKSRIFEDTANYFKELCDVHPTGLQDMLNESWATISDDLRPLALRYLTCAYEEDWSEIHNLDGLIHYFGIEIATHIQHGLMPELAFPISASLRYDQLVSILTSLGINQNIDPSASQLEKVLDFNASLAAFASQAKLEPWQIWATIYDFGPKYLLSKENSYPSDPPPKIWITAAGSENFDRVDKHTDDSKDVWSINPEARRGDIVMMYCLRPRSAIIAIYRCGSDAYEDPMWEPWGKNQWAELRDRIAIPQITLQEMKKDRILKDWSLVRTQFKGMLRHRVSNVVWDRIKEIVMEKDDEIGKQLSEYSKSAKGIRTIHSAKSNITELAFEEQILIPLLQDLGWQLDKSIKRQHEMRIKVGSGFPQRAIADFVGFSDTLERQTILIVENKRQITTEKHLRDAVEQCESYAGKLRCSRFVIAAPQGIWVYNLAFPRQSELILAFEQDILTCSRQHLVDTLSKYIGHDQLTNTKE